MAAGTLVVLVFFWFGTRSQHCAFPLFARARLTRPGSELPGAELFRLDLATAPLRAPPGLRHWREGVAVVVPLDAANDGGGGGGGGGDGSGGLKRELWLRCKTVEEADAWRHALFDRQVPAHER